MTKFKYQHVFFDLDRTLWDFDSNSEASLNQLYRDYGLQKIFGGFLFFQSRFDYHNRKLWVAYYQNRIKKKELMHRRFFLTLKESGLEDLELAQNLSSDFIEISPLQNKTFPNAHETLDYLAQKGCRLHIITNGFNEVQGKKLKNCGLDRFFTEVITSEDAGANKPDRKIFEYAMGITGASPKNSVMIGDDLTTDIAGAKRASIDQVFVNYHKTKHNADPTYEVADLLEITKLF